MMRVRLFGALLVAMLVASGCQVYVQHDSVRVIDAQEDGWLQDGDELVLATFNFRTTPGVEGSTWVEFDSSSLDIVAEGLHDGDVAQIRRSDGFRSFDDVEPATLQGLLAGEPVELIGQIIIGFEKDWTLDLIWDVAFSVAEGAIRDLLADNVEGLDITSLFLPGGGGDDALDLDGFADIFDLVSTLLSGDLPFIIDVLLKAISFLNADDLVGFQVLAYVPADAGLGGLIDGFIPALPPGINVGAFPVEVDGVEPEPKRLELLFAGQESEYVVTTFIGSGGAGIAR